jgi:pyrophosphatase PpaX
MTQNPRRAALFDLDGTLVDSMPFVVASFIHAVTPYRARPTEEEVLSRLGGPLETCLRNILGDASPDVFAGARARLMERQSGAEGGAFPPFDGAREALDALQARGVPLGIWTGRDRWSTERILKAQGLSGYFGSVVCGDDLGTHKPDPEGLLRAVRGLGSVPAQCVFLGDADVDIIGGRRAGVRTILLLNGRAAAPEVVLQADECIEGPRDAYAAVLRFAI